MSNASRNTEIQFELQLPWHRISVLDCKKTKKVQIVFYMCNLLFCKFFKNEKNEVTFFRSILVEYSLLVIDNELIWKWLHGFL